MARFIDRRAAGRRLAEQLIGHVGEHPLVLALPRGGVPVGFEVARALDAALDIWVVRKIGAPWDRELGLGAVSEDGQVYVNRELVAALGLPDVQLSPLVDATRAEVNQRVKALRHDVASPNLTARSIVVVDDGLATGGTLLAALQSIQRQMPRSITVAVPIAAAQALPLLTSHANQVICLHSSTDLKAVGLWYDDFAPVADGDVRDLLVEVKTNLRR